MEHARGASHYNDTSSKDLTPAYWVKRKIVLTAGQREPGGWGQLQKDTQSSDPADSTHRTNQGRDWRGSIHWREQILTGWGATRGVDWRCTNISCYLSLNGNLRGGTRVAYSINVSEFIFLLNVRLVD